MGVVQAGRFDLRSDVGCSVERGMGAVFWLGRCAFVFFFFFQAEDGIRDRDETGVQTCALPIYSAAVFLRDPESSAMVPNHRVGPWWRAFETLRITPGRGVGGTVMVTGQPLRTDDYRGDPRVPPDSRAITEETGTEALMVVPILLAAEVVGLLYISNRAPRAFTDEDRKST